MFQYYFVLGLRSLRRNPVLTALMILTLAVGVAASISTLTILHVMSGDPIPHKSRRLLVPLMDNGPASTYIPGKPPGDVQMTFIDANNLLQKLPSETPTERRVALYDISGTFEPDQVNLPLVELSGIGASSDYFGMFEIPFLYGGPWSATEDKNMAQVIVLSQKSSEKLFGNANPVGRRIRIFSQEFQVVGVLADWHPVPRYTHLINGNGSNFSGEEEVMIPFATAINLQVPTNGSTSCYTRPPRRGFLGRLESECTWIQFWIEAKTDAAVAVVKDYIDAYTREQKKIGRFLREAPNKVYNVMEWMEMLQVVSNDNKVAVWLAFGFLLLCLVNTMGLLLAKFSVRAAEVGVRRSLGATRGDIFHQFLLESSVIGIAGGVLGLLLSFISLWLIARQSKDLSTVAHMDWEMLGLTLILAVVASVLAGLLPTWRACQVTPALQLKSQ